eukprot:scaffold1789_cov375-Prasinococcus_capsulatus_cf.AAC.2
MADLDCEMRRVCPPGSAGAVDASVSCTTFIGTQASTPNSPDVSPSRFSARWAPMVSLNSTQQKRWLMRTAVTSPAFPARGEGS